MRMRWLGLDWKNWANVQTWFLPLCQRHQYFVSPGNILKITHLCHIQRRQNVLTSTLQLAVDRFNCRYVNTRVPCITVLSFIIVLAVSDFLAYTTILYPKNRLQFYFMYQSVNIKLIIIIVLHRILKKFNINVYFIVTIIPEKYHATYLVKCKTQCVNEMHKIRVAFLSSQKWKHLVN